MVTTLTKAAKKRGMTSKLFNKLGFVFCNLAASQAAYTCIIHSNRWLQENVDVNISAFFIETAIPCVPLRFARFHVSDLNKFNGSLVATSFDTALVVQQMTKCKRFFYIQDFEWTRNYFKYTKQDVDSIMMDESLVKIARCKDHHDLLLSQGIKMAKTWVEDFDIKKILEITNAKTNKG